MNRKRTSGGLALLLVLVLVGGALLLRRGGEPSEPGAPETRGPSSPTSATRPTAPSSPKSETPHAPTPPTRLVPATREAAPNERLGAFEGRVVSATTGMGVEGAELTFSDTGGVATTQSEAQGHFRFVPRTAGPWQLAGITARGYLPFGPEWGQSPIRFTVVPGQRITGLVLALTPELELHARVEDAEGQPVAGAQVRVLTEQGGESVLFPTTDHFTSDAHGELTLRAPEGALVVARHPAHASARAEVTRAVLLSRRLVLKLGRSAGTDAGTPDQPLAGRVVDSEGTAMAGALVSVTSAASAWPRRYGEELGETTMTDPEGHFTFEHLEPGTYDVTARRVGLAPGVLRDVPAGRTDLLLTLSSGMKLVGTVRDASTHEPLPSFTLAVSTRRGPLQREPFAQLSFIDAQGRYEVTGVPPGGYVVQAAAPGYAPAEASVELPAGTMEPVTVDLTLSHGARMEGNVVEEGTELPLEHAQVSIEGVGTESTLALRYDALTDARGHFTLEGLPSGDVSLFVSAEGHHGRILSGITVQGDTAPPQRIELRRTEEGEEPQVELVGIGAVLAPREDALVLGELMAGGGAAEAGLATGDGILSIDGRPVVELGFPEAVQLIRGPEGSRVRLGVRKALPPDSPGGQPPLIDVIVTRRRLRR